MADLQYRDHQLDAGRAVGALGANIGANASQVALQVEILRQRRQQQEFENRLRFAQEQRDAVLDTVRERLYGVQQDRAQAGAEFDQERTRQLIGLSKLADTVEATTVSEELADVPGYSPRTGGMLKDTLENRFRVANAVKRGALERQTMMSPAAAQQRLRPFNLGPHGAVDPMGRTIAEAPPAAERLFNSPLGSDLYKYTPGMDPSLVRKGVPGASSEARPIDPSLLLSRFGGGIETAEDLGFDLEGSATYDPETYNALIQAFRDAAMRTRPAKTNAPSATPSSKYKILNVSP